MKALKQADVILSPSQFLRTMFIDQGIEPNKIVYSRLGLDTNHWITPPASDTQSSAELRLSYIGQLAPHKGVHLLIQAFESLVLRGRRPELKVYGDGQAFPEYTESLQRMASGNPRVTFAGRFENRRVAEILEESDVVVVPSTWYENSPVTIMEALTTGTPVVTADIGGMSELVQHDVNGLLFERANIADLTDQLQRLLDEPNLISRLASNAHPVRTIEDEMEQMLTLYGQVVR
jgi:glycosyltransferase involved in cell wall biosynthesis